MRPWSVFFVSGFAACTWNIPGLPGAHADDQLACEEAASRLSSCCGPSMTWSPSCVYKYRTANIESCHKETPDIDDEAATCILGTSCDDLVRLGACSSSGHDLAVWHGYEQASCKR
jgi:hypothetical protein